MTETPLPQGKAVRAGTVHLGEEKAQERRCHQCVPDAPDGRQ